jgi:23S rRNA (adenine-N6)-dimethyltransferase
VGAEGRRSGQAELWPSGQHLLRSDQLAQELVAQAKIGADDLVVEIGAGAGRLTEALARTGARVVAVELDPSFAMTLRRRFRTRPNISVVEADVMEVALPDGPFRSFGNIPFGLTTAILRRLLDDPHSPLQAADLIVQHEVARKRASVWPSNLASLGWLPWWDFRLTRHLPASAFSPAPSVDAGLLTITRRSEPLLPECRRREYVKLLRAAFRQSGLPVRRSLRSRLPEQALTRIASERGLRPGAKASDLDVFDWVALFLVGEPKGERHTNQQRRH